MEGHQDPIIGERSEEERAALEAKIAAAVAVWTGQLVDLGGRNTLLYYRDLKQGTLALDEADPVAAGACRLSHRPAIESVRGREPGRRARRARTVRAKAAENFEERGLQTLFLAWGMATWTNTRGTATPAAPVLLRQAHFVPRGGAEEDFDLSLPGEWEVNPTLLHLLRRGPRRPSRREHAPRPARPRRRATRCRSSLRAAVKEANRGRRFRRQPLGSSSGTSPTPSFRWSKTWRRRASCSPQARSSRPSPAMRQRARSCARATQGAFGKTLLITRRRPTSSCTGCRRQPELRHQRCHSWRRPRMPGPSRYRQEPDDREPHRHVVGPGKKVLFVAEKRAAIDAVLEPAQRRGPRRSRHGPP